MIYMLFFSRDPHIYHNSRNIITKDTDLNRLIHSTLCKILLVYFFQPQVYENLYTYKSSKLAWVAQASAD